MSYFFCSLTALSLVIILALSGTALEAKAWTKELKSSIKNVGKAVKFTFSAEENHLLLVRLKNEPATKSPVDYHIVLKDKDGNVLYRQTDDNGSDGTTVLASAPNYLRYTGKYELYISDKGNDEIDPQNPFTITLIHYPDPDKNEPNNGINSEISKSMATPLTSGATKSAMIEYVGDQDWYRIDAQKGQLIDFHLEATPKVKTKVDYCLTILDEKGKILYQNWHRGDRLTNYNTRIFAREGGTYFCRVHDWDDEDWEKTNSYLFTATILATQDQNEPNDGANNTIGQKLATRLNDGQTLVGALESYRDEDWYKISAQKDQLIDIAVKTEPFVKSSVDYALGVYDVTGKKFYEFWLRGENSTTNYETRVIAKESGDYYICLWDWDNDEFEKSQKYTIKASILEQKDTHERNNGENNAVGQRLATKLTSGAAVTGALEYWHDEDWYKIDIQGGQLLEVVAKTSPPIPSEVDYVLGIYDSSGSKVYENWIRGENSSFNKKAAIYANEEGPYYICIWDWDEDEYEKTQQYELTAFVTPCPDVNEPNGKSSLSKSMAEATLLPKGTRKEAYIQSIGDKDTYLLQHGGGKLVLSLQATQDAKEPVDTCLRIYDEKGKRIHEEWHRRGQVEPYSFSKELPAGKYYAQVFDWEDDQYNLSSPYTIAHGTTIVPPADPSISTFQILPNRLMKAGPVRLRWVTSNADSVRLYKNDDYMELSPKGQGRMTLTESTVFTLQAMEGTKKVEAQRRVVVGNRPDFQTHFPTQLPTPTPSPTTGATIPHNPLGNLTIPSLPTPTVQPPLPTLNFVSKDELRHIVIIHGTLSGSPRMKAIVDFLEGLKNSEGKQMYRCYAIDLTGRAITKGVAVYGKELADFIERKVPAGKTVDLIGFSQGALIARWYVQKLGGHVRAKRIISICGTNHGTKTGMIARIGVAVGAVVGAPLVLPGLIASPTTLAGTSAVVINVPVAGVAAAATSGVLLKSLKDQDLGSTVLNELYDSHRQDIDYRSIWFSQDNVVHPSNSSIIQGGHNYCLNDFRHMKAAKLPSVHELVAKVLEGSAKVVGPQRLRLIDMIGLNIVRGRDYMNISTNDLVGEINQVLGKIALLNRAEQALITVFKSVKQRSDWANVWSAIDKTALFKKVQGKELDELYEVLGPRAAVDCALARNSKIILNRDVYRKNVLACDLATRARLLQLQLNQLPLLPASRDKMLMILQATKDESQSNLDELVRLVGGKDRFYKLLWLPANKAKLQSLLPMTKPCLRCKLSGKTGYIKETYMQDVKTDCPQCVNGLRDCNMCQGKGTIGQKHKCLNPACKDGKVYCSWCKGTKKVSSIFGSKACGNPVWKGTSHKKNCPNCGGDGWIEPKPCPNKPCGQGCPKGKVKCTNPLCKGQGYWFKKVPATRYVVCPNCHGKGEVPK